MTIKLGACFDVVADETVAGICIAPSGADGGMSAMAWCDTPEERDTVLRALENVLLPRFTRDEAIAIVRKKVETLNTNQPPIAVIMGMRMALEALAAAGVFWDGANMRDKLDAAGM